MPVVIMERGRNAAPMMMPTVTAVVTATYPTPGSGAPPSTDRKGDPSMTPMASESATRLTVMVRKSRGVSVLALSKPK
ncbi:hypothetical protein [uncultured Slackia sp.]